MRNYSDEGRRPGSGRDEAAARAVLWPRTDFAAWSGVPWNFRSRDIDELIAKDTSSSKTQGKVIHQPLAVKREDASILAKMLGRQHVC